MRNSLMEKYNENVNLNTFDIDYYLNDWVISIHDELYSDRRIKRLKKFLTQDSYNSCHIGSASKVEHIDFNSKMEMVKKIH